MSTSAHDPIPTGVLAASDPAELLAFVRIRLAQEARDELVLVGCDGYDLGLTCSLALEDLLGPAPSCDLATTLAGMAGTGVDMVFALIILGDGHSDVAPDDYPLALHLAGRLGTLPLLDPALPEIHSCWVLGEGYEREVRTLPVPEQLGAVDLAIRDPQRLAPVEETRFAAQAVLDGAVIPRPSDDRGLEAARPIIGDPSPPRVGPREPMRDLWPRMVEDVERLIAHGSREADSPFVTVCERLGDAVRDLADPLAQEELATFLIGHEREPIEDLNEGLGALLGGWEMRPHADVRPGGRWFRCLDGLRRAADPPDHVTPDPALLAGWAHLTSVQALLAWSECRFGSAARLAESALGASSPDALARWVLAAADAALAPCWHRVRTESRRR